VVRTAPAHGGPVPREDTDLLGAEVRLDAKYEVEQARLDGMAIPRRGVAEDDRRAVEIARREPAVRACRREGRAIARIQGAEHEQGVPLVIDGVGASADGVCQSRTLAA